MMDIKSALLLLHVNALNFIFKSTIQIDVKKSCSKNRKYSHEKQSLFVYSMNFKFLYRVELQNKDNMSPCLKKERDKYFFLS